MQTKAIMTSFFYYKWLIHGGFVFVKQLLKPRKMFGYKVIWHICNVSILIAVELITFWHSVSRSSY